jgi:hypothetical protein
VTIQEFCASTNLTDKQVYTLRDASLIRADMPASQVEFARLVKAAQNAQTAIGAIAKAKGACLAVDLSAIRQEAAVTQKTATTPAV